jgi:hypothetical protein
MLTMGRILWHSALPIACLVVLLISAWSWWVQPEQTQIGFARVPGGNQASVLITRPDSTAITDMGTPAWRMHVRLERGIKAPGPAWVVFEGEQLGTGYELHWDPLRLALTVQRSQPPLVLGAAHVEHMPSHIAFIRHGFHLSVLVDDKTLLTLIDPQTTQAARTWGFQASGALEGSTLSIIDEADALSPLTRRALQGDSAALTQILADFTHDDHALFMTQQALNYDPEKNSRDRRLALQQAQLAITALTQKPTPDDLRHGLNDQSRMSLPLALQQWINWGTLYSTMLRPHTDAASDIAENTAEALQNFARTADAKPTANIAGLSMHVLASLVQRATRPPMRAPEDVVQWRAQWLAMVTDCATLALHHPSAVLSDDWRWQLRLIKHASLCLRGLPGEATPVAAPEWVSTRWRACAGGNPKITNFPPLPNINIERSPLRAALDQLMQLAAFDFGGLSAVSLRASVLDTLFAPPPANALQEIIIKQQEKNRADIEYLLRTVDAPARELLLTRAILALNKIGNEKDVLEALDHDPQHKLPADDGSIPLARRDPLAYALYRLLLKRTQPEKATASDGPFAQPQTLPSAMPTAYVRLLSGSREALHEIAWIPDPNVIPPAQALAAGLAMQEAMQEAHQKTGNETASESAKGEAAQPNWSLLEQVPCFTLPLHLLIPGALPTTQQTPSLPVVP